MRGDASPEAPGGFESQLSSRRGGGSPMAEGTRTEMEGHFGSDFSGVRIHTDSPAVQMSQDIGARAFTHGSDIYFNQGQYNPGSSEGKHLLAHELTHTVQQGASPQVQAKPSPSEAVAKKEPPANKKKGLSGLIQRIPFGSQINRFAQYVPGWTLMTVVIGYNPLTEESVPRTAQNFLRGVLGLHPVGTLLYNKLNENGLIDRAFQWLLTKQAEIGLTTSALTRLVQEAWDQMDLLSGFDYNVNIITTKLRTLYNRVVTFATVVAQQVVKWIQEAVLPRIAEWVKNQTRAYPLFTVMLGQDPITREAVPRTLSNIIQGFLMLTEEGENYWNKLQESGKIAEAEAWLTTQLAALNVDPGAILQQVIELWNSLTPQDVVNLPGLFQKVYGIFAGPIGRIMNFMGAVALKILQYVKEAMVWLLKQHAHQIPGYPLLTVLLGRDPLTQEAVPRTPQNFIKGFLSLVPGGLEKYAELEQAKTIEKTMAWLSNEVTKLNLSWEAIVGLFTQLWNSFTINDLLDPIGVFQRIFTIFQEPVSRIVTFAVNVGTKVLEFIFQGFLFLAGPLGQKVFEVIQKAGKTIKKIYKDPIQFIKNLLAAAKKGVEQFVANILTHLQRIILNWLFGEMADEIQIPERFDLMGILDLAMQVLGLTYQNFRGRLADRIGEENVARLEGAFEFIKILVTQGIAAAWEKILEYGTNIINGIIDGVKNMVITKIVEIGAQKLAMMLAGPYGAIVEAVITTYRFIATLIERINQIADFVKSIVDSVAEIADGKIQAAADYVERMIVKGFTMFISFLAGVVGLGSIPRQVKGVIEAIRRPINQAMDAVIGWVVRAGQALMGQGGQQEGQNDDTDYSQATPEQKKAAAKNELEAFISRGGVTGAQILAKFPEIKAKYHLSDIRLDFGPEQGLLINYFASPAGDPTAIGDGGDGSSAPPAAPPPPSVTVTGDNHDSPKTPYQAIVDAYGAGNVNRSKFRSTRATYDRARHIKMELVGGGVRGNRGPNQGIANSMGYDEHMVRHGRNPMDFQGGHLIGHHVSGAHSDEARNLAPQASAFNYTTYNHLFEKVMRSTGQDPTRASHVEVSVNLSYASTNVSLSHADLVTNGILHSSTPANPASVNLPKRIPQLWNARLTSKDGKPLPDREIAETRRTAAAGNVVDNVAEFNNLQIDVTNRSERYKHFKVLINQGGNVNADGSISAGGGSVLEVTGQQQD